MTQPTEARPCPRCGLVPATESGIGHEILCRPSAEARASPLDLDAIVSEQRMTDQSAVVRTLSLVDADGKVIGGIAFAATDALFDLPLWVRDLIREVRSLRSMLRTQRDQQEELDDEVAIARLTARAERAEARLNAASKDDLAERLTKEWRVCPDHPAYRLVPIDLLRAAADRIRLLENR